MRYAIIVNNDERLGNGEEDTFEDAEYAVGELLRSGYFQVESVQELTSE